MKSKLLTILLICACASLAQAQFNPIALTPGSFTQDIIVEKTAPPPLANFTTATLDQGTNNYANTFFEQGYVPMQTWLGLPVHGTTFMSDADANHFFKMPPTYTGNNSFFVGAQTIPGTSTLNVQVSNVVMNVSDSNPYSNLSVLWASGGSGNVNVTVNHADGSHENTTIVAVDWFTTNGGYAWIAQGRLDVGGSGPMNNLRSTTVTKLFSTDIAVANTSPVTNLFFSYTSNSFRFFAYALSGSTDGVSYAPVAAISGFNVDSVIEADCPVKSGLVRGSTVTMDQGPNNGGNTFYEQNFGTNANPQSPMNVGTAGAPGSGTTGLPHPGTTITAGTRSFKMPPTYTGNCCLFVGNYGAAALTNGSYGSPSYLSASFALTNPAPYTAISVLTSAGNGPATINYVVAYDDGSSQSGSVVSFDWFNAATTNRVFNAAGRVSIDGNTLNNVNGNPAGALFYHDIPLNNTTASATNINFTWASGGRAVIFALSGQTTVGGAFSPSAISGFNADVVVEAGIPLYTAGIFSATTATMDLGTNNANWTWFEKGWVSYGTVPTDSGLPAAGSTFTSLQSATRTYRMPASYTAPNAVLIDTNHQVANITPASPATYSAFALLTAGASIGAANTMTNICILQHADGTAETNFFYGYDWFNTSALPAYIANGRADTRFRIAGSLYNSPQMPRLFETIFTVNNTGSAVTNIQVQFVTGPRPWTTYVLAVSASAGAVPPVLGITLVNGSSSRSVLEGSNIVFSATTGGTTPITNQWQFSADGTNWSNVVNGGFISGATTPNLTNSSVNWTNSGRYRLTASNAAGFTTNGIGTLTVYSGLQDVIIPTDTISIISGTTSVAEPVIHAIDDFIQKYLNFSTTGGTPFTGPVGFTVRPAMGNTIVNVLRIYTANDAEERDPADYVLEGSLDGSTFSAISSGPLALPAGRNTVTTDVPNPLVHYMQEVHFANVAGYNYYRVSFNNVKNNAIANSMQFGEIELLGVVNPNPPPSFTISPTDIAANEGTTATFTSLAVGAATLTYQWYDVTAGDPGTLLVGKTSANLQLPAVTLAQSGNKYRVVATNPYGSVTNPSPVLAAVQLTVNTGPVVISQDLPAEVVFYAGRTEQLTFGVTGSSPVYQWQSNGVPMVNGGRVSGVASNVLTIANVQLGDAAVYQVVTSNSISGPLSSAAATAYVTVSPTFHTNGVGWQILNGTTGAAAINGDVLNLTDNSANEQHAAWFAKPMNLDGFKASFVYQDVSIGGADGFAFVIQNSPQGTNALGGGGGGLAYLGIPKSVAVMFNIYANNTPGISLRTNGAAGAPYDATPPVDISNGDPIQINLLYAGSTLQVTLSNTVSAGVFTTNYSVGSLSALVGTNVAYFGITGATGGSSAQQQISNIQYVPLPTLSAQNAGGSVQLAWPASIGGYSVQSSPRLTPPAWSAAGAAINQANGQNQTTVSPTNGAAYYRLDVVPTP